MAKFTVTAEVITPFELYFQETAESEEESVTCGEVARALSFHSVAGEQIAEWRRGCSCADVGKPEECQECTRALIEALDKARGATRSDGGRGT